MLSEELGILSRLNGHDALHNGGAVKFLFRLTDPQLFAIGWKKMLANALP